MSEEKHTTDQSESNDLSQTQATQPNELHPDLVDPTAGRPSTPETLEQEGPFESGIPQVSGRDPLEIPSTPANAMDEPQQSSGKPEGGIKIDESTTVYTKR